MGIDTTTNKIVVALGEKIVSLSAERRHSEKLLPAIDRLIKSAGITPPDLAGVVVAIGPGNFTGLRVGVVVANGIGYGAKKPVAGVSEFERIRIIHKQLDVIVLDAGRDEVFVWSAKRARPALIGNDKLGQQVTRGSNVYIDTPELVAKIHTQIQKAGTIYIGPIALEERMAAMMATTKMAPTVRAVEPLYLREANITKAKR